LTLALSPLPSWAGEPLSQRVEREYVGPLLEQVTAAARSLADPGAAPSAPALARLAGPMAPAAAGAAAVVQSEFIEPLFAKLEGDAAQAVRFLASADATAPAPVLEAPALDLRSLVRRLTGGEMSRAPAPADAAGAAGGSAPAKDSTSLVRGAAEMQSGRANLAPVSLSGRPTAPGALKPLRPSKFDDPAGE
jgi:hypothetical protein